MKSIAFFFVFVFAFIGFSTFVLVVYGAYLEMTDAPAERDLHTYRWLAQKALNDTFQEDVPQTLRCCDGNDPACLIHGVAASNARENEFYKKQS